MQMGLLRNVKVEEKVQGVSNVSYSVVLTAVSYRIHQGGYHTHQLYICMCCRHKLKKKQLG